MELRKIFQKLDEDKETKELKAQIIQEAKGAYFAGLSIKLRTESLEVKVKQGLLERLFSDRWLDIWCKLLNEYKVEKEYYHKLKETAAKTLDSFSLPEFSEEGLPSSLRMGLAGAIGAFLGMTILSSPAWRGSVFIGAAIGSFLLVCGCIALSKKKISIPGMGWNINELKKSILGITVLRSKSAADVLEKFVTTWLDALIYAILSQILSQRDQTPSPKATQLSKLIEKILLLRNTPKEELPMGVEELVQTAEILGFEIQEGQKTFRWNQKDSEKYDTYGHVEIGQEVIVKRSPIILQGKVQKKGLVVRKV